MKMIIRLLTMVALICGFAVIFKTSSGVAAEEPYPMLSWQAESFVPFAYSGRALPTVHTPVWVYLDVIQNGKQANLSSKDIRWYVDGIIFKRGKGLTSIELPKTNLLNKANYKVRVEVAEYSTNFNLSKTLILPLVKPQVEIEAPFYGSDVSPSSFRLIAWPYYFQAGGMGDLNFVWSENGIRKFTASPNEYNVVVDPTSPVGSQLKINLTAAGANNFESASRDINFYIRP